MGGVLVCDYLVLRRGVLSVRDLYRVDGRYAYRRGVNGRAMIALLAGILVALAGTLTPALSFLFSGAWFSAALVAAGVYYMLMRRATRDPPAAEETE